MENVSTETSAVNSNEPQGVASQGANQPTNDIPGAAPGETKAETMKRMHKVTIDGAESEIDEDELKRGYTHAKAAEKKMNEAAKQRQEVAEILKMLTTNPEAAMKQLGLNPKQFAEQMINRELEEALMSPEQRRHRDMQAELTRYQQAEREAMERYQREQEETSNSQMIQALEADMMESLASQGVPKTDYTVGRIIYYMEAAIAAGHKEVRPQDVMSYVKSDYAKDFKEYIGALPDDLLEEFLGKDILLKAAKKTVDAGFQNKIVPKKVNEGIQKREKEQKSVSPREYFRRK